MTARAGIQRRWWGARMGKSQMFFWSQRMFFRSEIARAVGIGSNQDGGEGDDREGRYPAAMVGRADGKEPDVLLVAEDVLRQEAHAHAALAGLLRAEGSGRRLLRGGRRGAGGGWFLGVESGGE